MVAFRVMSSPALVAGKICRMVQRPDGLIGAQEWMEGRWREGCPEPDLEVQNGPRVPRRR